MRARTVAVVAMSLTVGGAPVWAEEPAGADPSLYKITQPDESPTNFSCDAETLLSGARCAFESEAAASADAQKQAAANVKAAEGLAEKVCVKAASVRGQARPDRELVELCRKDFKAAAGSCEVGGEMPLLDAHGRFAPKASSCYWALGEVVRRTRLMSSVTVSCCRCALEAGCLSSVERCHRDLLQPTPKPPSCAKARCAQECSALLPVSAPEGGAAPFVPAAERKNSVDM